MKRSKFSDSQILSILKEAESGIRVPDLCRAHGMSDATFYKWRDKFERIYGCYWILWDVTRKCKWCPGPESNRHGISAEGF